MLPLTLRHCASQLSRKQRSPTSKPSKKPRPPIPAPSGRPKLLALWPLGMLRPGGPLRPNHSTGSMAKPSGTWRHMSSERKAEAKLTSSLPARLPYMPAQGSSKVCWWLLITFCWGRHPHPPIHLTTRDIPSGATVCPSSSSHASAQAVPQAQKVASFPRPCGQHASGQNHIQGNLRRTPSSKW